MIGTHPHGHGKGIHPIWESWGALPLQVLCAFRCATSLYKLPVKSVQPGSPVQSLRASSLVKSSCAISLFNFYNCAGSLAPIVSAIPMCKFLCTSSEASKLLCSSSLHKSFSAQASPCAHTGNSKPELPKRTRSALYYKRLRDLAVGQKQLPKMEPW